MNPICQLTRKTYFTNKYGIWIANARLSAKINDIILSHLMWFRIDLARDIARNLKVET